MRSGPVTLRRAPSTATRLGGGFTLIELLVVIGIIMIFMGISIGAILHTPRVNALVGTEHMVADVVRQARHAARSSGTPVTIEISQTDRSVLGVSQLMLWNETFEETAIPPQFSVLIGRSGKGLTSLTGPPKTSLAPIPLDRSKRLARRTARGRTEGFYISCSVKPGPASDKAIVPLILVGSDDEDQCTCGLVLQGLRRKIQHVDHVPVLPTTPAPYEPTFDCWEILGWVNSESSGKKWVSSINDVAAGGEVETLSGTVRDTPALFDGPDIAAPMNGDSWDEVGMLYDGERLELYRNGVLVGAKPFEGGYLRGATVATDDSVHLGHGKFPTSLSLLPVADQEVELGGIIDDARLYRLAIDRAGTLPAGVTPQASYRITVHPDGHVQASSYGESPATIPVATSDLKFAMSGGVATRGDQLVTVNLSVDGVVTSATTTVP